MVVLSGARPALLRQRSCKGPIRLSIKKSLFPVQRVAKIKASRAAAIYFFFPLYVFFGLGKYCPFFFFFFFFAKMKKKSLVRPLAIAI